jgi:hypothetical protein
LVHPKENPDQSGDNQHCQVKVLVCVRQVPLRICCIAAAASLGCQH